MRSSILRVRFLEDRLAPAILTVNSDLDNTTADDGLITLREAITTANADAVADTIVFDSSLNGKFITLNGTFLPQITTPMTIQGPGANLLAISGNNQSRIVDVVSTGVTISGLTLTGCKAGDGGAIFIVGGAGLTIVNCAITNNEATNVGGAIRNGGTLTVTGSTISGNKANTDGGAIAARSGSTTTIINSTLSGNTANGFSGAIDIVSGAIVTVGNSTIVLNRADADGRGGESGGGIDNGGTLTLFNTIVAGNILGTGTTGNDITSNNVQGASVGNVIGDAGTAGGLTHSGGINIVGNNGSGTLSLASIVNPTLAFNGGPTLTHTPIANGPAIGLAFNNKALDVNNDPLTTDQRGSIFVRASGGMEAGAVELLTFATLTVSDSDDLDDGDYAAGKLTLREALALNNVSTLEVTNIDFASALTPTTITLNGSDLARITDDVIIQGPGAELLTIDGKNQSLIMEIVFGATVSLSGLTLTRGQSPGTNEGGAIFNGATLTITDCHFIDNKTQGANGGGAILNNSAGKLTIENSTFSGNSTTGNGGAIVNFGDLILTNSTLTGNNAGVVGGGISNEGKATITNATIVFNTATDNGGGIRNRGTISLLNTIIAGNLRGTATEASDLFDVAVSADSVGNLIGDAKSAGGLTNGANNLVGIDITTILNPTLADNGGPTFTHALIAGSPAIDFGKAGLNQTDQRGLPVILNDDVGAFENQTLTIAPTLLPPFIRNRAFSQTFTITTGTATFTSSGTLPDGITLSPTGILSGTPTRLGTFTFTIIATSAQGDFGSVTFTARVSAGPQPFAIGGDVGSGFVRLFNPDGTERLTLTPFGPTFTGGIRVAVGDVNGDGIADVIVGSGPGVSTRVIGFDGVSGQQLFTIEPFEPSFTGGVFVAVGDMNGDGIDDVLISPDEGGGPRVRIFEGVSNAPIADFFGIDDPNFRGGARLAVGDVNGDGRADLAVAAGFQGGPRVAVFDGLTIAANDRAKLFGDFFIFEETLRNGAFIAVGDVDGDGFAEVIGGGGPGGGPRVFALSGKDLLVGNIVPRANFFAGNETNRGGIRIIAKEIDDDSQADLITGDGSAAGSTVSVFLANTLTPDGTPPSAQSFATIPGFSNGIFVG